MPSQVGLLQELSKTVQARGLSELAVKVRSAMLTEADPFAKVGGRPKDDQPKFLFAFSSRLFHFRICLLIAFRTCRFPPKSQKTFLQGRYAAWIDNHGKTLNLSEFFLKRSRSPQRYFSYEENTCRRSLLL